MILTAYFTCLYQFMSYGIPIWGDEMTRTRKIAKLRKTILKLNRKLGSVKVVDDAVNLGTQRQQLRGLEALSAKLGAKLRSKGVVSIIARTVWDSLPPKKVETLAGPRLVVWFSDTATPECKNYNDCISTVQELQIQHMDVLRLPDIKHNFLIGGDGRVYEGRGFGVKPSNDPVILKTYPAVEETLDIAYITTLEKGDKPSRKMLRATKDFLKYSKYSGHLTLVVHHEVLEWEHGPRDVVGFMKPDYKPASYYEEEFMTKHNLS